MELIRPPCGDNRTAHLAHHFWDAWGYSGEARECPGWSPADASACQFVTYLMNFARRESSVPGEAAIPVLECHPSVVNMLVKVWIPDYDAFESGQGSPVPPEITVTLQPGMPPGAWRLVLGQGTVSQDHAILEPQQESGGR